MLPRAVHEFETAVTLDPLVGLDRLYETIGGLYVNQANFDSAVDAYAKRVDVNPNNADAHRKLGEIYFLQGRNDEALAEFGAALLIDPESSDALAGASQVYERLGRYAAVVDLSRRALALDASHNEARYALATSLMRLGNTDEGKNELEIFRRVEADTMANAQRQSELKVILRDAALGLAKDEYIAAAALLRKALTIDPNIASVPRNLGIALMKSGRYDEAVLALDRSLQLEDTAEVHQLLADAYRSLGRLADSESQSALVARAIGRMKEERLRKMGGARR
jgi:tetratricopeptide (TPR) repeat protein